MMVLVYENLKGKLLEGKIQSHHLPKLLRFFNERLEMIREEEPFEEMVFRVDKDNMMAVVAQNWKCEQTFPSFAGRLGWVFWSRRIRHRPAEEKGQALV